MALDGASTGIRNALDLGVSKRTHSTLPLFWSVADAFREAPEGLRLDGLRFELRRSFEIDGTRWIMSARLACGWPDPSYTAKRQIWSVPYIHLWASPGSRRDEPRLTRQGTYARLAKVFAERGYTVGWDRPFDDKLAWATTRGGRDGLRPLREERAWLEQVLTGLDRVRVPPLSAPRSAEALWDVLGWFRGDRAGPWTPVGASYSVSRPAVVGGRVVGNPRLLVHADRRDQGRRTARSPVRIFAGIEFFMRELAEGDRRRLRARGWFTAIAAEMRRLGYRGEWYRMRKVQPLGAWRRPVTTAAEALRECKRLGALAEQRFLVL